MQLMTDSYGHQADIPDHTDVYNYILISSMTVVHAQFFHMKPQLISWKVVKKSCNFCGIYNHSCIHIFRNIKIITSSLSIHTSVLTGNYSLMEINVNNSVRLASQRHVDKVQEQSHADYKHIRRAEENKRQHFAFLLFTETKTNYPDPDSGCVFLWKAIFCASSQKVVQKSVYANWLLRIYVEKQEDYHIFSL